jgi:tetratricopeptide (TPR) repeat protein
MMATLVVSCGGEDEKGDKENGEFYSTEIPDAEVLRVGIKQLEDSLMKIDNADTRLKNLVQQAYIEKLKLMYQAYPDDKQAPVSLSKVYKVYAGMGAHEMSVKYADSLIEKYPDFSECWMAFQSNALYYDIYAQPRDKEKARYYLEKLVNDYPNLDPEILDQSKSRLETIDIPFEDLIKQQNQPN